jgi:hypothetical protein
MPSQSAGAPHILPSEVDNIVAPRLELHARRGCHGEGLMSIFQLNKAGQIAPFRQMLVVL